MDIDEWRGNTKKTQEVFTFNSLALVGGSLLLLGIFISLWVIAVAYNLFNGSEPIALLQTLTPDGSVVLPDSLFQITGYVIYLFLLGICGKIGVGMVNNGVHILQPQNELLLKKIKEVITVAYKSNTDSTAR